MQVFDIQFSPGWLDAIGAFYINQNQKTAEGCNGCQKSVNGMKQQR
jgi:hypothetical protein